MFLKPRLLLGFAIGFVGGLAGDDSTAILLVAVGAFIPACGVGRAWWIWFVLTLCAWAGGAGVLKLMSLGGSSDLPGMATQLDTMLTVVAALSSAVAGTSLNWAASRMMRLR